MTLPPADAAGAVQAVFIRATADDYDRQAAERPDLALQIDYYVPAWTPDAPTTSTRVLVVTGEKWRISAIEAFLKAISEPDDGGHAACDESPF